MPAVDTNVLVRLVVRDDARQVALAEAFIREGAWVSHLALAEATWVMTSVYELSPGRVADVVEMLVEHKQLVLQERSVVLSALAAFRKLPKLGFSDCLMVEVARNAVQAPLGTFDRDLARLAGAERLE